MHPRWFWIKLILWWQDYRCLSRCWRTPTAPVSLCQKNDPFNCLRWYLHRCYSRWQVFFWSAILFRLPSGLGVHHFIPVIVGATSAMLLLFATTGVSGILAFPVRDAQALQMTLVSLMGAVKVSNFALLRILSQPAKCFHDYQSTRVFVLGGGDWGRHSEDVGQKGNTWESSTGRARGGKFWILSKQQFDYSFLSVLLSAKKVDT